MKKYLRTALIAVFATVFLVSGYFVASYLIQSQRQQSAFQELAGLVEANRAPVISSQLEEALFTEVTDPKTGRPIHILRQYAPVYEKNSDVVGWLKIEGTKVNYPVMQTPDRTDYYLRRSFEKKYSTHGCLYAREACDVFTPSDNVTVYGHNMKDGSMFAALLSYKNRDFFETHRYIQFDTIYLRNTYEILAVFTTTASEGEGFAYHRFIDAETAEDFDDFVSTCKALAYYDTGISAQYGDKLITLSTCDYSRDNGRLVVVAKQVAAN